MYFDCRDMKEVKVGVNVSFDCNGAPTQAHYRNYLNGELMAEGSPKYRLTFIPPRSV